MGAGLFMVFTSLIKRSEKRFEESIEPSSILLACGVVPDHSISRFS
jgi:hypothetical protein